MKTYKKNKYRKNKTRRNKKYRRGGFFNTTSFKNSTTGLTNTYQNTKTQLKNTYNHPEVQKNIQDISNHSANVAQHGTKGLTNAATGSPFSAAYRGYKTYKSSKNAIGSVGKLGTSLVNAYKSNSPSPI